MPGAFVFAGWAGARGPELTSLARALARRSGHSLNFDMRTRTEIHLTGARGRADGGASRPYLEGRRVSFRLDGSVSSVHDIELANLVDAIERNPHLHEEYTYCDQNYVYLVKTTVVMNCRERAVVRVRLDAAEVKRAAFWLEFTMDARVPGLPYAHLC